MADARHDAGGSLLRERQGLRRLAVDDVLRDPGACGDPSSPLTHILTMAADHRCTRLGLVLTRRANPNPNPGPSRGPSHAG